MPYATQFSVVFGVIFPPSQFYSLIKPMLPVPILVTTLPESLHPLPLLFKATLTRLTPIIEVFPGKLCITVRHSLAVGRQWQVNGLCLDDGNDNLCGDCRGTTCVSMSNTSSLTFIETCRNDTPCYIA